MAAEVASAFVALMPSARRFGSQLDSQISGQVGRSGRKAGGLFSRSMRAATRHLGPLIGVAAAGGFVKAAVGLEAEFGKVMNQMAAVTGAPKAQMKSLNDLAIKMGQDTVFSAKDAADAMLEMAKNGISPATIKAGALKSALTLAAAGGVSMGDAATVMGNALNAFNLKGNQSAQVSSALAGAANASSASIGSLSEGLAQSSASAHASGLSIQETTAALAAFANKGIQGSDAGTSLKTFLSRLIPQTDKAAGAMVNYGLASYNANVAQKVLAKNGVKMSVSSLKDQEKASLAIQKLLVQEGELDKKKVGMASGKKAAANFMWNQGIMDSAFIDAKGNFEHLDKITGALSTHLKGLSQSQRQQALQTIFGSDAQRAANILVDTGKKGIDKYVTATNNRKAADKLAAAGMKGTAGAIEQLKGSLETVTLQAGQAIAPVVQRGLGAVTKGVNALPGIFKAIGSTVSAGIAAWKISPLGQRVANAFNGVRAKVAGKLKGIGTWIADAFRNTPALPKGVTGKLGDEISSQLGRNTRSALIVQAKTWAKPVIDGFKKGLNTGDWSGLGSSLGNGIIKALAALGNLASKLTSSFDALFKKIDWIGIGITIGKQVPSLLLGLAAGILNFDLWGMIKGIGKHWQDIVLALVAIAFTPGKIVGKVAEVLARIPLVGKMLAWALTHFKGLADGLRKMVWRALKFLGREFMVGFRRVFPNVGKSFGEALRILPTRLGVLALEVQGRALKMVLGIARWIGKGIGKVVSKIGELTAKMLKPFAHAGSWLFDKGRDIVRGLWNGIKRAGAWFKAKFTGFIKDHIPGWAARKLGIRSPSTVMAKQAQWIPKGMAKGITANAGHVDKAMGKLTNRIALHAPTLEPSAMGATAGRGGAAIRGTLAIDRDGVAYIHGVSRQEVHTNEAARRAASRAEAMMQ